MRTLLNTDYRTLIVYLIIYASISLQFKAYSPKFVIKFLALAILPFSKNMPQRNTRNNLQFDNPIVARKSQKQPD